MKQWVLRDKIPDEVDRSLSDYPELARHLLFYRDIKEPREADRFLNPDYDRDLHDPFLMLNMDKAVGRILKAIGDKEKIIVFGDYDADGISGSVTLVTLFKKIGFENYHVHIPDRYKEGYGMTLGAIDEFIKEGANLIITIDCGITDVEETKRAQDKGIDVIILDHHLVQDKKPEAFAILDSKQEEDEYPFKYLSGAGVAFKLVQGLIDKGNFNITEGWEKWLLDAVSIATVSDMVALRGENRVIVHFGLKVLQKTRRVGLKALYKQLKLDPSNLTEDDIGFMIGPRINTASRMDHATTSFNLLTTENEGEGKWIASHLEGKNGERKEAVKIIIDEIEEKFPNPKDAPDVIVAGNVKWLPGVLGLGANRIMDSYHRPVFLWGKEGSHNIKGSCRSDGTINLVKFMESISDSFIEFGGHAAAAGFGITDENVVSLEEKILEAFKKTEKMDSNLATLDIDKEIDLDEVNWGTWEIIKEFAPFGMENPKPVFLLENIEIDGVKKFGNGGIHLELSFKKSDGKIVKAIGFFMTDDTFSGVPLELGKPIDLVATMERSTFAGRIELRLRIVDIKKPG